VRARVFPRRLSCRNATCVIHLLLQRANAFWWRASSEGSIGDCIEIFQMTIKLRVLNSSSRLVTSTTETNGKSTVSLPHIVTPDYGSVSR